jgi:hypothetical protein
VPDDDGSLIARRLRWGAEDRHQEVSRDDLDDRPFGGEDAPLAATLPVEPRITGPSFERRELDRMDEEALDRRRQLWRDTSILLIGLLVVLLVGQVVLPATQGLVSSSASPGASDAVVGPAGSGSPGPGATFVSIVDPSLGIDAPHTPGPVRTEPPTGSAAPTAHPIGTPRPTFSIPTATPALTPPPTPISTPTPEPTDAPTPIPPPNLQVACAVTAPLTVTCSSSSSDTVGGSQAWAMGGSGTVLAGGDGVDSITFLYDGPGDYHIVLGMTGLDGSTPTAPADVTV